jgi:Putative adhesin
MRAMGFTRFVGLSGILAGCGLLLSAAVGRPQAAPAQLAAPAAPAVPGAPAALLAMAPTAPLVPAAPVAPVAPSRFHVAAPNLPSQLDAMTPPEAPLPPVPAMSPMAPPDHSDRVSDCSDLHMSFDGGPAIMETEERTVSKAEASTLRIDNLQNAGVQFRGWDKDNYSVTLCKFADRDRNDAKELLSQIKMSIDGGRVSISGPGHEHNWAVHLLISTPRGANLDIQSKNGPVSFSEVDGKIYVRATNGPVSMSNCTGEADLTSQNGPISISGKSGKLKLHTENGPISIALQSPDWSNGGLVADAVNGPVSLSVPSELKTSFVLESRGHAPITCHASVCANARKTFDDNDNRRIEYGDGAPVIRLSTVNGPVTVNAL